MYLSRLARTAVLAAPRRRGPALLAGALLLSSAPMLFAQASSGITGTVTDPSGAVIPGANISIVGNTTQTTTKAVSSDAGTYTVTGLIPGRYTVTVTAPGFATTVQNDVNVEVTVQSTINFTLNAGANETVTVSAPLIALNTTQPELGTTVEQTVVQALPTSIGGGRGRQIDTLQFLAPGVQGDTFSHRINGGVDFETEILYNGIPAPQSETAGSTGNFNPPFELVNEFRVERSTFSAKYGLAQGAVTYQTASGTNALHGDLFYINRNEFFDARGFFNTTTPIDRENDGGGTVGGPVIIPHLYNGKDKTFFLASVDLARQSNTNTGFGTLPTPQEKTGDFSDFINPSTGQLIPIFDPQTGRQFQYQGRLNVIDPARISRNSATVIPFIRDPDRPGLVNNTTDTPNAFPNTNNTWGFTIDHNLTPTQSLHWAEWRNSFTTTGFDGNTTIPQGNPLQSTKSSPVLGSVFLLNYVNSLTPKLVLTAGVSWIGEINNQFSNSPVVNFAAQQPSPIAQGFFPKINFDGQNSVDSFGVGDGIGETQSINRKLGLAFVNNWLWTKGINTFNFGGEARRSYQDDNECQNCTGTFNFSQRTTADPNNLNTTGSSFASFLLGQVDNASRTFANELSLRNLLIAPYIQDDIKLTSKLTVNLGLRWDIMLPFTEKSNQIVYLNQTALNPAAGNLPGVANRFGNGAGQVSRADLHLKNFGPRVGVAYQLTPKSVLQAGYNLAFLNGGAYEYGTSKVATSYGNLLQGVFSRNSTNSTVAAYGSWDTNPLPAPPSQQVNPALGLGTTIRAFNPVDAGRPPYLQQWNVNYQRQLPWNTFVQVAYIGNRAVHLDGQLNPINQQNPAILQNGALLSASFSNPADAARLAAAGFNSPYPGFVNDFGGGATLAQALSPFPQYSNVYNNFDLTGTAAYNGLQATLEKRFSNGLSFLTSYTLSRTLGNVDSGFTTFASLPENKFNQKAEYTVTGNDELNNVKISGAYDVPVGPGRKFVNNKGPIGQIVGGIQLGFFLDYETGHPLGISENGNPLQCAGCFNRPNEVAGVSRSSGSYKNLSFGSSSQSVNQLFTTNAFVSTENSTGQFTLGNAQRNYADLRGPGLYTENLKATKAFEITEHVNFELEMNYFNLLNRTRFNGPNTNIDNTSNFGFVPANGQQGLSGSVSGARNGQLSGRITF